MRHFLPLGAVILFISIAYTAAASDKTGSLLLTTTKADCETKNGRQHNGVITADELNSQERNDGDSISVDKKNAEYVECELPASDSGKSCKDSSECEKHFCYAPKNIGYGKKRSGTCGTYYPLGCALEVKHGVSGNMPHCYD